jgi:hypothetical protein
VTKARLPWSGVPCAPSDTGWAAQPREFLHPGLVPRQFHETRNGHLAACRGVPFCSSGKMWHACGTKRPRALERLLVIPPLTCTFSPSGRRDSNPRPSPWQVRALDLSWTFANYRRVFSQLAEAVDNPGRQRPRDRRAIDVSPREHPVVRSRAPALRLPGPHTQNMRSLRIVF